jgi:hypothetical protein
MEDQSGGHHVFLYSRVEPGHRRAPTGQYERFADHESTLPDQELELYAFVQIFFCATTTASTVPPASSWRRLNRSARFAS